MLTSLGALAQRQGKHDEGTHIWTRALAIKKRIGDRRAIANFQERLRACNVSG